MQYKYYMLNACYSLNTGLLWECNKQSFVLMKLLVLADVKPKNSILNLAI